MKVCLDARVVDRHMHGITRYALNLIREIANLGTEHEFFVIGRAIEHFPFLLRKKSPVQFVAFPSPPYTLIEQVTVPWLIARIRPAIYHCLTYACPVLVRAPLCLTLHDVLPLARPGDFRPHHRVYFNSIVRVASMKALKVIVDSSYGAACCARLLKLPLEKISIVPLAGDHMCRSYPGVVEEHALARLGLDKVPFFMCVTNQRPHKRMHFLVEAFLLSSVLRDNDVRLVLVGEPMRASLSLVRSLGGSSRVHCVGYVNDRLLALLYKKAVALVCPSVGEGFGLPVLEAMSLGTPVVAAEQGAPKELLNGSGLLLPEENKEAWSKGLGELFVNVAQRKALASRGSAVAHKYSWRETAQATVSIYGQILGQLQVTH